jgi:hypothetical protein
MVESYCFNGGITGQAAPIRSESEFAFAASFGISSPSPTTWASKALPRANNPHQRIEDRCCEPAGMHDLEFLNEQPFYLRLIDRRAARTRRTAMAITSKGNRRRPTS